MRQYALMLRNEKEKFYLWFSWLMIIANLAFFVYLSAASLFKNLGPLVYVFLGIIAITYLRVSKKERNGKPRLYIPFFIIILGWVNTRAYWWVALIIIILMVLDEIARRKLIVQVLPDKIVYPSFPHREIKWNELSNMILKDGLLTIDFKNNQLIQQLVDENWTSIAEKEFNEFCRQQLNN